MKKMNILVTGNKGYIGSVLTSRLAEKGYNVTGFDTDYYEGITANNQYPGLKQINKDIRAVSKSDLQNIDAVIHLAALSNDPIGEFNPKLTYDINYSSTLKLAKLAKEKGIERFVFASSQSMYGISNSDEELDEENSTKNPITAYARAKWDAECGIKKLSSDDFAVTCLRLSTVFGVSPKLRCDIVFNNLVASAYTTGRVEIKSDGTPWRPVLHVRDACNAFISGLEARKDLVANQSFNVGIENGNYTVKQLAEAAQKVVKGSQIFFTGEHGQDSRTYKVSFKKILTVLKDYYKPEWDLIRGGEELVKFFDNVGFTEEMFKSRKCIRLEQLKYLIKTKALDENLFWKNSKNSIEGKL